MEFPLKALLKYVVLKCCELLGISKGRKLHGKLLTLLSLIMYDIIEDKIWSICDFIHSHYIEVIMTTVASQITSLTVVYSTVYSDADQRKHQSSASLAFVWGIHWDRWIPRTKGQLRGKCFHLMTSSCLLWNRHANLYTLYLCTMFRYNVYTISQLMGPFQ